MEWAGAFGYCFPCINIVTNSKGAIVWDLWNMDEGGSVGILCCQGTSMIDKQEEVHNFCSYSSHVNLQPNLEDRTIWMQEESGKFSVQSLCEIMDSVLPCSFLASIIWQPMVRTRVASSLGKLHGDLC